MGYAAMREGSIETSVASIASAIEAIRDGAAAYLLKDSRIDDLLGAIRGSGAGQVVLPVQMVTRMARPVVGIPDVVRRV